MRLGGERVEGGDVETARLDVIAVFYEEWAGEVEGPDCEKEVVWGGKKVVGGWLGRGMLGEC